ncbi:nucleoside-specific channel-forming protein Tsx [Pokkaliibacter sp. MBI-7]|uniref:nucleoside-specific channel-forming protein Tsx n=1 Tax=Pokkaliibacter sp. MBI-7 TaxID=3040600 RepID=UPI00244D2C57|nr:nucleoside-specific channel-forming protein Tsx [Pokkaliibacter sp. MBI-7]MDH2432280.1 nucleoside-specific channel-forming protein Tsx [Pokkaliibacter sp. MBI-7]
MMSVESKLKTVAVAVTTLAGLSAGTAQAAANNASWFAQDLTLIHSHNIKFSPRPNSDTYLEYEYVGRQGPVELYGYVDVPKVLGDSSHGSKYDTGVWDDGSPVFMEHEPRISIDSLTGKDLSFGPFKEWYVAFDWIYDNGDNRASRQNTLYAGIGTDIDTHSPLMLSANVYARRQWENYGAANENSWDGYRLNLKYILPLNQIAEGLTYIGFTNYDFDSDLGELSGPDRTNNALVSTNVLHYKINPKVHVMAVARYFHNGGQWKDGQTLNWGDGNFTANSNGWGTYFGIGYDF